MSYEHMPMPSAEHESPEDFERRLEAAADATFAKMTSKLFHESANLIEGKKVILAMMRLASKLKEKLPDYQSIVSDDASARLPSLFFRHLVNAKRNAPEGAGSAQTFFVAFGRPNDDGERTNAEAVDAFIDEKRAALGKTLVVTEYVDSGASITHIAEQLDRHHVDFEIATISWRDGNTNGDGGLVPKSVRDRMHVGTFDNEGLFFYGQGGRAASGVIRDKESASAHPERIAEDTNIDYSSEERQAARKDIETIAEDTLRLLDASK